MCVRFYTFFKEYLLLWQKLSYLAVIALIASGCASKGQNHKQNLGQITMNISSEVEGYKKQKSVLTYWCKLDSKVELDSTMGLDSKEDLDLGLESNQDAKLNEALKSKQDLSQQTYATQPSKCVSIGGANAFNRVLKTSRFRAPKDEVAQLESGVYYLDSFEIEGKRNIWLSCDNVAGKCNGWDYAQNKPKWLAFAINARENLILPQVIIKLLQSSPLTKSTQGVETKRKHKEESSEVVFVILGDLSSDEEKNLPHKAESKRGNAIFSLGFGAKFEFANSND